MSRARVVYPLLLLALVVIGAPSARADRLFGPLWPATLGPLPALSPPSPLPSLSAQTCNGCHGAIHDQWASSGHATAATNPVYLAAVSALGSPPLCQECHLPLANQRVDLPRGPGALGKTEREPNPAYSPTLAQEGVTCAACHVRDGVVIGPRELTPDRAPHPVRREAALQGAEACVFCHQAALPGAESRPFLDTVGEWSRSHFSEAGVSCQNCHMTRVAGAIAGSRYAAFAGHGMLEGRTGAALARALTVEVALKSSRVQRGETVRATVQVMNTGAGHAVPTGDPGHQVEIRFAVLAPDGKPALDGAQPSAFLFREVGATPPFVEVRDERLAPAASRTFDFAWLAARKLDPGLYTVVVSTHWWAVAPERGAAVGLTEAQLRITMSEQRVPLRVE